MRSSFLIVVTLVVVCVGIACAVVYLRRTGTPSPVPMVQPVSTSADEQVAPPEKPVAQNVDMPQATPVTNRPVNISVAVMPAVETNSDEATNAIHQMVDALLTAKNARQKHDLFQQLIKSGQMDAAIAELKQRESADPKNVELPTTIGEALLNQVREIHDSGDGDLNEMGILAMQADQNFNAALKIDPQNWEANFVKASSMYYWPADPVRDGDVVQRLSNLIDQQETMSPNPAFVQTYVVLGNEYQKIGQPDKAQATWLLGLQKFPGDPVLQGKVNGQ